MFKKALRMVRLHIAAQGDEKILILGAADVRVRVINEYRERHAVLSYVDDSEVVRLALECSKSRIQQEPARLRLQVRNHS